MIEWIKLSATSLVLLDLWSVDIDGALFLGILFIGWSFVHALVGDE